MTFSFKAVVWNGVPVIKLSDFEPTQLVSKELPNCHVRCCTLIVPPAFRITMMWRGLQCQGIMLET